MRERVMTLTTDFPKVWHDPHTTDRDRKRMIRLLIDDVTLIKTLQGIVLHVRFRGGNTKTLTLPALQRSWQAWQTSPQVVAEIDRLLDEYLSLIHISEP